MAGWKNGKHTDQGLTMLESCAFPKLGKLRVDQIEGPMICGVLAEIWLKVPETARRVNGRRCREAGRAMRSAGRREAVSHRKILPDLLLVIEIAMTIGRLRLDVANRFRSFSKYQHGNGLVVLADKIDDRLPRARKRDIFDIDLVAQLGEETEQSLDGSRIAAIIRAEARIPEAGLHQEQLVLHRRLFLR